MDDFSSTKEDYQLDDEPIVIDFDNNVMGVISRDTSGQMKAVIRTNKPSRRKKNKFVEMPVNSKVDAMEVIHNFWNPEHPYRRPSSYYRRFD